MTNLFLAHFLEILNNEFSYGNSATALIIALVLTAVVLVGYLIIDHVPKPTKNRITAKNEPVYAKIVIAFLSLGMLSTGWDVWWHRAIGRDTILVPPHLGLYVFSALAIAFSFYVWRHSRDSAWKHLIFVLLFIPISAAFDNFFHTIWGVENYADPSRLAWSPGHMLLILSAAVGLVMLLEVLIKFRKTPDFNIYGTLCFGGIYSLLLVLAMPFHPTEGWGQIAGFMGAGIIAAIYVATMFGAEYTLRGTMDATMSSLFALFFMLITFGKETASHVVMLPHDRPPIWLIIFSLLIPAIILDLTKNRFPLWVRGMFAGIAWSGILFGFSSQFFARQFQYGLPEIFLAITFSALAGLTVASIFSIFHLDDEKHIEKLLKKW